MVVVSNSTPLIALSKIGVFDLLKDYFGEIMIPNEVYEEVVTRGSHLFGASHLPSFIHRETLIYPHQNLIIIYYPVFP
jgi:predicted nucleic acid-binding protein